MSKRILYASCLCTREEETKLLARDPGLVGQQIQKYHRLLAQGLTGNGAEVHILSYHRDSCLVGIRDGETEQEDGMTFHHIASRRSGALLYGKVLWDSYRRSCAFLKKHPDAVVLCDVLNFSVSLGAVLAAKRLRRQAIGIVTDFPDQLFGAESRLSRLLWKLIRSCTGYVVMTEQMKEFLPAGRKTVVLEGHADREMARRENRMEDKKHPRVCLYAGGLHRKYGIETLVQAFLQANIPDAVLEIYGDGDYAPELRRLSDPAVRYHGIVPNARVVEEELTATLLINPRPTDEEFTRYSFPSKNMEYMASGTPVLTTRLPGMPREYAPYVYLFDGENAEGMAETLRQVLSRSGEELHARGCAARRFVLEEKSNVVQAGKILRLLEENGSRP